jgi:hypothetical protein
MTSSPTAVFWKRCMYTALFAGCGLGALPGAAQAEVPEPLAVPDALHGLWVSDDADGRAQCTGYRALADSWESGGSAMVGMLVVTPTYMQTFAEYGEGNFYQIQQLSPLQSDRWKITAWVGIDELPEPGEAARVEMQLQRQGKRLSVEISGRDYHHATGWRHCTSQLPGDPA